MPCGCYTRRTDQHPYLCHPNKHAYYYTYFHTDKHTNVHTYIYAYSDPYEYAQCAGKSNCFGSNPDSRYSSD